MSELAQIRKQADFTQREVAEKLGVGQSRISELEHADLGSVRVDTLRRYLEAMGGQLVIVAAMADGSEIRFGDDGK